MHVKFSHQSSSGGKPQISDFQSEDFLQKSFAGKILDVLNSTAVYLRVVLFFYIISHSKDRSVHLTKTLLTVISLLIFLYTIVVTSCDVPGREVMRFQNYAQVTMMARRLASGAINQAKSLPLSNSQSDNRL